MRLKKDQVERLGAVILSDLEKSEAVRFKTEKKQILETINTVILNDIKAEEDLEKEAEKILDQSLKAAGSAGIDRHKMLKMIKEKLAKDRNIIL